MITLYHDVEQNFDSDADPAACRAVVDGFLELESRYCVSATYNVVGRLYERQPELVGKILAAGHEVAFHSYTHDPAWEPARYADEVAASRAVSAEPVGYRSPRSRWDQSTLEAAWRNGFLWNAESDPATAPYFIHKGLVRLPIAGDDWRVHTGETDLAGWIEKFSALLTSRSYFGWGSHDFTFSFRPREYLAAYERILRVALEHGTSIVTFSQAADWHRRSALAAHYDSSAAGWNQRTSRLYRTKRFQEIICQAAGELMRPIVVDLGSGGGVLSRCLRDTATAIYCVDNAPGMLADVPSDEVLRPVTGEITDSTLPDDTADLVICARVVEYAYDPGLVADEIARVAKRGAVVVATFPAARAHPPENEGAVPDRIRRHFTREQVRGWIDRIGSGDVIGVQYDEREPRDEAAELEYRRIESEPPQGASATNWVVVGRNEKKRPQSSGYRLRPLKRDLSPPSAAPPPVSRTNVSS